MHLDWLSARTDNGVALESSSWGSSGDDRNYYFRVIPTQAKTADFTFAVQRSRWVEYTLRPEVGTARQEARPLR
jgi:hypothetical protein